MDQFEWEERECRRDVIAEAASTHRQLEHRLKKAEEAVAKAADSDAQERSKEEALQLACELAAHQVPEPPRTYVDDAGSEKLSQMLAQQGGRLPVRQR